jgi:hypothetical protein
MHAPVARAAPVLRGNHSTIVPPARLERDQRRENSTDLIRHYWQGKVACKSPRYGLWGGPPGNGFNPGGSGPVEPAQDLANAPRGKVSLPAVVTSGLQSYGIPDKPHPLRAGEKR